LFFGNTTTEPEEVRLSNDKGNFEGNLMIEVMTECSSVDETIILFESFNLSILLRNQFLLGDGTGSFAAIEGNMISRREGPHQILTNFRYSKHLSNPEFEPCRRYHVVMEMLGDQSKTS
jgi:hypothetical protein